MVRLPAQFEARVLVLDVPVPLLAGRSVTVHAHVAREAGVVAALVSSVSSKTGEVLKAKPRCAWHAPAAAAVPAAVRFSRDPFARHGCAPGAVPTRAHAGQGSSAWVFRRGMLLLLRTLVCRCLLKGQSGVVVVQLERAMCLEEFQDVKPLGRVALRDGGKTLAVGVVTRLLE